MKRILPIACLLSTFALGQTPQQPDKTPRVPKVVPVPPLPRSKANIAPPEPTEPPARSFTDPLTHISFRIPAGWTLSRRDGEVSTFHLDARTAAPATGLRAVAAMQFNPLPWSTFAGGLFYLSSTPRITASACAAQATGQPNHAAASTTVGDVAFARGHDEHGLACVEARDEVLTAYRRNTCVRFDLVVNTFCPEASGARAITDQELQGLHDRLQKILDSAQFTPR